MSKQKKKKDKSSSREVSSYKKNDLSQIPSMAYLTENAPKVTFEGIDINPSD